MGRRSALVSLIAALFIGAVPAHATFPGANGRIAFVSNQDGDFDIYTMDANGLNVDRVTETAGDERNPAWSPDGHRIAYDLDQYVHVIAADGSWVDRITTCYYDSQPAWSPDGTRHVLFRQYGKVSHILTRQVDGQNEDILEVDGFGFDPEWSPDGEQIVYVGDSYMDAHTVKSALWVVNSDGSNPRRLTEPEYVDSMPAWHPDSSRIAFASARDGDLDIYVLDLATGTTVQLTNGGASDYDPVWSPDGTKIAFVSYGGGDSEIYVMNADGSSVVQLTVNDLRDEAPTWQATPTSEAPAPPEGPEASCTRYVDRSISLRLKDHLVARGTYEEQASNWRCGFDLRIERKTPQGWRNVMDAYWTGDHRYEARIADRKGRYRARLKRSRSRFYSDRWVYICSAATSEVEVHRH